MRFYGILSSSLLLLCVKYALTQKVCTFSGWMENIFIWFGDRFYGNFCALHTLRIQKVWKITLCINSFFVSLKEAGSHNKRIANHSYPVTHFYVWHFWTCACPNEMISIVSFVANTFFRRWLLRASNFLLCAVVWSWNMRLSALCLVREWVWYAPVCTALLCILRGFCLSFKDNQWLSLYFGICILIIWG